MQELTFPYLSRTIFPTIQMVKESKKPNANVFIIIFFVFFIRFNKYIVTIIFNLPIIVRWGFKKVSKIKKFFLCH